MWDASSFILVALIFLFSGFVKGVVGLGLPTIAIALLTTFIGLKPAVALTVLPVVVTNFWQAVVGGQLRIIVRRLWSLMLPLCAFTWFGAKVLATADPAWLGAGLGVILAVYSGYCLMRPQIPPPGRRETWLAPIVGAFSGLANGMVGTIAVPGVLYLQTLGMKRDTFVQALGVVFVLVGLSLGVSLSGHGLFPAEIGLVSAAALIPAVAGMWVGQTFRKRLSEERFRIVFFVMLLLIGVNLAIRPLL